MWYGGEPWESRGTGWPPLFSTSTSSLLRSASSIASDSAAKSAWSSCPSVCSGPRASSAIELAVPAVSWTNASRSWSIAPSASGTTAAMRTAAVSSTSASAIRLVTARPARSRRFAPSPRPRPADPCGPPASGPPASVSPADTASRSASRKPWP